MTMCCTALVLLIVAVAPATHADDDAVAKFRGEWVRQGGGVNPQELGDLRGAGLPIPERGEPPATLRLDGSKWKLTGGTKEFAGSYSAKGGEKFHTVDLVVEKDGKEAAKFLGIITDYKNGTWELALNLPGKQRPETSLKAAIRYVWKSSK